MNKLKAIIVAASLMLVTVGVFAGKFTSQLWALDGTNYIEMSSTQAVGIFTTTANSRPASISDGTTSCNLYDASAGNQLYFVAAF